MQLAQREGRIVLTEDKDFGRLVYAEGMRGIGVILLRYPSRARAVLGNDLVKLIEREGGKLTNAFVVMQSGKIRIRRKRP